MMTQKKIFICYSMTYMLLIVPQRGSAERQLIVTNLKNKPLFATKIYKTGHFHVNISLLLVVFIWFTSPGLQCHLYISLSETLSICLLVHSHLDKTLSKPVHLSLLDLTCYILHTCCPSNVNVAPAPRGMSTVCTNNPPGGAIYFILI